MTGEELFLSNYSFSLTETFSSHELYNLGELRTKHSVLCFVRFVYSGAESNQNEAKKAICVESGVFF